MNNRLTIQTDIRFLKGIGEARAVLYEKLGVSTVNDLIRFFPRDYIDLSQPCSIADAQDYSLCAICAVLVSKSSEQRIRKGLSIFKLLAVDETGEIVITIFNAKYTVDSLVLDKEFYFYGKISGFGYRREMHSPMIFPADIPNNIIPVYPQTAGIKSTLIRKNVEQALTMLGALPDSLPEALREQHELLGFNAALQNIHFPSCLEAAKAARNRFIFEELLTLSCALFGLRNSRLQKLTTPLRTVNISPFISSLPFSPTNAQFRCIDEIAADLQRTTPMNRLLQGDVGSGKTLVSAAAVYIAIQNGFQAALMAPTEILAEQHFQTFSKMLAKFDISIEILTSSTKPKKRREILQGLREGSIDFCIGTHALLSETVAYNRLGLVITDEQHRFGVNQRTELSRKAENCHVLVMSATPIPRTLSLLIYGDLQLSIIDELPPGRHPIETLLISSSKRKRALNFIREAIDEGRQAYIVCPLIEVGEVDAGLRSAIEYANQLRENEFVGYKVGLLHGRMTAHEKESIMSDFKSGDVQLLVSTTIVEVGVDVPNATIILIENADRFGLSQLHQLRGRIGRGNHKSWCILLSDSRGDIARERLEAMKQHSDGFLLAELDLKIRGPGDFFSERQHGLPILSVASLADNTDIMQKAQSSAAEILERDPTLSMPEHSFLLAGVKKMLHSVGERPN